jgi:hypothetical protein
MLGGKTVNRQSAHQAVNQQAAKDGASLESAAMLVLVPTKAGFFVHGLELFRR